MRLVSLWGVRLKEMLDLRAAGGHGPLNKVRLAAAPALEGLVQLLDQGAQLAPRLADGVLVSLAVPAGEAGAPAAAGRLDGGGETAQAVRLQILLKEDHVPRPLVLLGQGGKMGVLHGEDAGLKGGVFFQQAVDCRAGLHSFGREQIGDLVVLRPNLGQVVQGPLAAHQFNAHSIPEFLAGEQVDALITLGELAEQIEEGARLRRPSLFAASFRDKEEMTRFLEEFLKPGDCVLFKGSNSMKLGETALYFRNKGKDQAESAQARG